MRKKTVITILLVLTLLVTGLLFACNDKCTEHVDDNNDNLCDVCGEKISNGTENNGENNGGNNGGSNGGSNVQTVNYTISVKNVAGLGLNNVTAYVRDVETNAMIEWFATDENGSATKGIVPGNYYVEISPSNIPTGYVGVGDGYKYYFNANRVANIVLNTQIVEGAHTDYKLGSVMKDFTVTTVDGETTGTFTLSEALETHDAVLLNFFFTTCSPCISEFSYLNEAASMYDNIAVIAVDTYGDTLNEVSVFKSTYEIDSVEMGVHSVDLYNGFGGNTGYPTSVMIDRYGVICLIEIGALPYLYPWTQMFEYFGAENYKQKLFTSLDELTPQEKPNISQPSSEEVANLMNGNGLSADVVYYPETEASDAEYYWPFVTGNKEGYDCMMTSTPYKYNSTCAMHVDVPMQQNQALSLDYLCSSELNGDNFYVMVNGEVIYTISGNDDVHAWKTLYPYVAVADGTYKVSFVYHKDYDTDEGDDRVYIKNLSIVNKTAIDIATYIPRNAVSNPNELNTEYQNYANVVFNAEDGYYHVGSENGPLLLANMMNYVLDDVSEGRTSIYLYGLQSGFTINSVDYFPTFVNYASYASNSEIGGYCTVNEELKGLLEKMSAHYPGGVRDRTENGWLRFCRYYDAYGTAGAQLTDPIAGLAPFSAYETILNASVGLDEYPNSVEYNMIIMPRGKIFSFTPETSGVYRIISNSTKEVDGWIFNEEGFHSKNALLTADHYERLVDTNGDGVYNPVEYGTQNVCMVYYFEAGQEYFIDIAFYDTNEVGTVNFKVEYLGATYNLFRYASPAPFTFYVDPETGKPPVNENGEEDYITIAGGVTPVLNTEDGYYYVGDSKIYVDFTLPIVTGFMSKAILSHDYYDEDAGANVHVAGQLELGAFNFAVDEDGNAISGGVDYSDRIAYYGDEANGLIITSDGDAGSERALAAGCVAVNEELATILQKLVDKYSFKGIKDSWTKLCYYFEYLGAE